MDLNVDKIGMKIKLRSFDPSLLDKSVGILMNELKKQNTSIIGPIALPRRIEKFNANHSLKIEKKNQSDVVDPLYLKVKHDRLIIVFNVDGSFISELNKIELCSGVGMEVQVDVK